MERLNIGDVIFKLRKKKGITQDELSRFVGVSTAAVSKWESNSSYPDITLLPVLATFFNVSIDELLNFKVELSDEEVMEIYSKCETEFSKGDLEKAITMSKDCIKKYPNSYFLKLRIACLFFAYSWKTQEECKINNMKMYSISLLEDICANCNNTEFVEAALFQLGALYLEMKECDKAVEALNKIPKSKCDPNDILSSVYIEQGKFKAARNILQSKLYKSIFDMSLACMGLANSYKKHEKDMKMVEKYYKTSIMCKEIFLEGSYSELFLPMDYLSLATMYLEENRCKNAIEMLRKMLECLSKNDINNIKENVNAIWCFKDMECSEKTLTVNLYENYLVTLKEPTFEKIKEDNDFKYILSEIKRMKEENE